MIELMGGGILGEVSEYSEYPIVTKRAYLDSQVYCSQFFSPINNSILHHLYFEIHFINCLCTSQFQLSFGQSPTDCYPVPKPTIG